MLRSGLDNALVAPRGFDHGAPFLDVVRQRFFHINVLSGLAGENGGNGVPVVRRGDDNGIDVFSLENVPEILVRFRPPAGPLRGGCGVGSVYIATRRKLHTRDSAHEPGDMHAPRAAADQTGYDALVRANHPIRRNRSRRDCGRPLCFAGFPLRG